MNPNYPKYQYSVFLKNGRDEQVVIRADDFEEFKKLKVDIDMILEKRKAEEKVITVSGKTCSECGTQLERKEGVNKFGKKWSGWACPNFKNCGAKIIFDNTK